MSSFFAVTTTTLLFFNCVSVGTDRLLQSAPAVDCASSEYASYLALAIILVLIGTVWNCHIALFPLAALI